MFVFFIDATNSKSTTYNNTNNIIYNIPTNIIFADYKKGYKNHGVLK